MEPAALVAELDAMRAARGMSHQAVADACGVSKATIYRTLTGATEPTMQLLQSIAAAVQYKPADKVLPPVEPTQESYTAYLVAELERRDAEHDRRVQQLHAHYNMLRRQDRRTITWISVCLAAVVAFLILWLIIDVTHPTVGWIRREVSAYGAVGAAISWAENIFL